MAQMMNKDKGSGGKVRAKKESTRVDMAPLVDLGFLLITFFMFTTTFSKPNIMNLNMPPKLEDKTEQDTPEIELSNSFTVVLGKDDRVFWHQNDNTGLNANTLHETDYSKEGLRKQILIARQKAKEAEFFTIIIKPTDDSNYKNLVDVLDEMEITKSITKSAKYGIVDLAPWELGVYKEKVGDK